MIPIPIFIPVPKDGYKVSRERALQLSITILAVLTPQLIIGILMMFDIFVIRYIGTTTYFVGCGLMGFITPFIVAQFLRKKFLKENEKSPYSIRMCSNCGTDTRMHFTETWCNRCKN